MVWHDRVPRNSVVILLAPEFDELEVVFCLQQFRTAGLPVHLISLSAGLVKGRHGLVIRPDFSLDQLYEDQYNRLVLLPGGKMCGASLLSDPRVHRLLNATISAGNYVAALANVESLLRQASFPHLQESQFFKQQHQIDISDFTADLINLMSEHKAISL